MSDAQTLMRLNREAQAKLAERVTALEQREARLMSELSEVRAQKAEADSEQTALARAEQVYRRLFALPSEESPAMNPARIEAAPALALHLSGHDGVKHRARLGPQRYLMFAALNEASGMGVVELAAATRLSLKRVKDQMTSDIRLGLVGGNEGYYRLLPTGRDLLERYRAYKKANNQPLPSLDDPPTEDDQDDSETNEIMEGATTE